MKQLVAVVLYLTLALHQTSASAQKFSIRYPAAASQENFSGNVFLYLSKENRNPKEAAIGTEPLCCYRVAVKGIKPNQAIWLDDAAVSYPAILSDIERTEYFVQAVWDRNRGGRAISGSAGNMYNKPIQLRITKNRAQVFNLQCTEVVPEPTFQETPYSKEVRVPSQLLSAFYQRPITLNAAVLLPREYRQQPQRRFPVLYEILGYGGDYHTRSGSQEAAQPIDTTACIRVVLDGHCPLGHSTYANSENNGPWGDALLRELVPAIESSYRCNAARLLTGHSSGGWAVLWLQTQYPAAFTACWSSSPDAVDFRDFQRVNLYQDNNLFYAKDSTLRWEATVAGFIPWASRKQAYGTENVISRGEQMHSYDAVFSQKNRDGTPGRLCNPQTGEIDSVTVGYWKNYDISRNLRMNWPKLKPYLRGKVRVSVGENDNFLLNYSVHLLDEEMQKINADFTFAYYPGDHFTVRTAEYKKNGYQFLQQKYQEFLNQNSTRKNK